MGCCGWPGPGGGVGPAEAQAGIAVARTTSLSLTGAVQNPTFDTVIKADSTGKFAFTPGTNVITIVETGSYRVSVYLKTRNATEFIFKLSLMNNGVEIPNIFTGIEEGQQQGPDNIDEYQVCLSIEAITLTAGTVQVLVQETAKVGAGTNLVQPSLVWSMAQNSGVAGANGNDAPGSFSRDEFFVFLSSDTAAMDITATKNAFKNAAQAASKMSVMYDKGSIVDVTNAKIIPTVGTWEIYFFSSALMIMASSGMVAQIVEDPDGTPAVIFEGTVSGRFIDLARAGSVVSMQIKVSGTDEFAFNVVGNDADVTIQGGATPSRTYAYGHRINTDPT